MGKKERCAATIWAPLAQIRISQRRRHNINEATVECYRQWLEQGREARPVRLARQGDMYVVRDAATASLPRWLQGTPSSRRCFNG